MYQLKKTEVTCICDDVYVLTDRAGCCVNLVVGKEKALVFDTGSGTDDIHGMVRKLTGLPLVVINSHGHFDHIGGNSQFDTVYMHQDDFVYGYRSTVCCCPGMLLHLLCALYFKTI